METISQSTLTSEYENDLVTLNSQTHPLYNSESNNTYQFFNLTVSQIIVPATEMVSTLSNKTVNIKSSSVGVFESKLIIPLYVIIFLLAVIGNSLVVITLAQNKRMRTVTNVYLLNLAVSDLLLGVFCMPFTLVGQVLRNFIFGAAMCKLIPYIQAVSVSVGVWTLVAISLERYFAICRPLKSRRWQTQFHAYKMIALVWIASLAWTSPILAVSTLKAMRGKGHKCREEWPSRGSEQAYNLFLDGTLLLMPLIVMTLAYSLIVSKLWKGLQREIKHNSSCQRQMERSYSSATMNGVTLLHADGNPCGNPIISNTPMPALRQHRMSPTSVNTYSNGTNMRGNSPKEETQKKAKSVKGWLLRGMMQVSIPSSGKANSTDITTNSTCPGEGATFVEEPVETTYTFTRHAIRSNYMDKSIEAKKNVIRMLFVIIAEFFICWAPLHVLNTVYLFSPELLYNYVGSTGVALVQLLAYVSSCCNPITYCFMNRKFRQAFLAIFDCYRCLGAFCPCYKSTVHGQSRCANRTSAGRGGNTPQNASEVSGNDSTIYMGRASTLCRSDLFETALRLFHWRIETPLNILSSCTAIVRYKRLEKWLRWMLRIVFSNDSGCGGRSIQGTPGSSTVVASLSVSRLAQVIEAAPDDASFHYRISWVRPGRTDPRQALYE